MAQHHVPNSNALFPPPTFSRLPFPFLSSTLSSSFFKKDHTLSVTASPASKYRSEEIHYLGSLPSAPFVCPISQVNYVSLSYSTAMSWPHCIYLTPLHLYFISFFAHYLCLSQYLSSFSRKNKNGSRTTSACPVQSMSFIYHHSPLI